MKKQLYDHLKKIFSQLYAKALVQYDLQLFIFYFQSELGKKKGDFIFQTGHVIEIVTKMFLVIQNATGKAPDIHVNTE